MRGGSDISYFLFHFCSRPLKNPRVVFSLIQYFKRDRACQSCLWGWQLPWGTLTVHGPLFLFETGPMLGHLLWHSENSVNQQRMKCRGLPFKTSGVPEAKWSVGLYANMLKKNPVWNSGRGLWSWRIRLILVVNLPNTRTIAASVHFCKPRLCWN